MAIQKEINWTHKGKEFDKIPNGAFGFVYIIEFGSGELYTGKKRFYQTKTMKPLKSGVNRVGGKFFNKIVNRKITKQESVTTENDWRTYEGSSKNTKHRNIKSKEILQVYTDSINLTYGELEWMIRLDVIRSEVYLNDNILGKFFRGKIK